MSTSQTAIDKHIDSGAESTPALEFHNVSVAYGSKLVITDIDFAIPRGALVGVLGPNGAGKSTLLKAALGIASPCSGWIAFFGESFAKHRTDVAYVPQRESVAWDFPATVQDVVMMGMFHEVPWWRALGVQRRVRAIEALKRLGMEGLERRPLQQLSGGQQQRVFLARAIVQRPKLLLLDEPLAGIDVDTEEIVMRTLKDLCGAGATSLVVHHDLSTVPQYFDRVLMVNARLISAGDTKDAFTPEAIKATYGPRLSLSEAAREAARPISGYRKDKGPK